VTAVQGRLKSIPGTKASCRMSSCWTCGGAT